LGPLPEENTCLPFGPRFEFPTDFPPFLPPPAFRKSHAFECLLIRAISLFYRITLKFSLLLLFPPRFCVALQLLKRLLLRPSETPRPAQLIPSFREGEVF